MDAVPPPPPPAYSPPAYVYAPSDIRPRGAREIELCNQASTFDWEYTGLFATGVVGGVILDTKLFKEQDQPGVRLIGPAIVGFSWGGFLGGGWLSLPKCDPTWAYGPPPEGDVRANWPIATVITLLAGATAPAIDFTFLGLLRPDWADWERAARLFIGMGTGIAGAIFPYIVPPRTWAAAKAIEKIRIQPTAGGSFFSYTTTF